MAVFIGNFVNDIIVRCVGEEERVSNATGGSVTYGPLAAINFGSNNPKIISFLPLSSPLFLFSIL